MSELYLLTTDCFAVEQFDRHCEGKALLKINTAEGFDCLTYLGSGEQFESALLAQVHSYDVSTKSEKYLSLLPHQKYQFSGEIIYRKILKAEKEIINVIDCGMVNVYWIQDETEDTPQETIGTFVRGTLFLELDWWVFGYRYENYPIFDLPPNLYRWEIMDISHVVGKAYNKYNLLDLWANKTYKLEKSLKIKPFYLTLPEYYLLKCKKLDILPKPQFRHR